MPQQAGRQAGEPGHLQAVALAGGTLADLVQGLRAEFNIPAENVLGHGTVKGTACPGGSFPWKHLFELMGLPAPTHLHRHPANLTTARCPWCEEHAAQK